MWFPVRWVRSGLSIPVVEVACGLGNPVLDLDAIALCEFPLGSLKHLHADDGRMRLLYKEHGQLAFILRQLVRYVVFCIKLLGQRAAGVLFLPDHDANDLTAELLPVVGGNTLRVQLLRYAVAGIAVQKHLKNASDYDGFLLVDDQIAVLGPIAVNLAAASLAAFIAFADAPFAVFRNAATLFLRKGSEDCEHQFTVTAEGVDVFLLEADLNSQLLQAPDRVKQVHRVTGKALYTLREYYVDRSGLTVSQHPLELIAVLHASPGNTVIGVNASVFPFRVLLDKSAVVAHLCGERVLHPLRFHGHSGVSSDSFFSGQNRRFFVYPFDGFQALSLLPHCYLSL